MRALVFLVLLASCGSDKETVIKEPPPVEQKEPLTKCDESHDLADSKIVECGLADPGVRVMVCTKLGWEQAYATCKPEQSRQGTPAILVPSATTPTQN